VHHPISQPVEFLKVIVFLLGQLPTYEKRPREYVESRFLGDVPYFLVAALDVPVARDHQEVAHLRLEETVEDLNRFEKETLPVSTGCMIRGVLFPLDVFHVLLHYANIIIYSRVWTDFMLPF